MDWFVAGIDWVMTNAQHPAIISASLGGHGHVESVRKAIDEAVARGIVVVVAAGNNNEDACEYTPAYSGYAITVGATDKPASAHSDERASYSNFGTCVDLLAPGTDITSAGSTSDTARAVMSGTSMACPHVSGAAALMMSAHPMSGIEVKYSLLSHATQDQISNPGLATPNLLLYAGLDYPQVAAESTIVV
jgi:subtilisin family serine protease